MRKLLMIGSILILGITAFAGVESDIINGNGEAKMTVGSRGIATDGTTAGKLIVTPIHNAGQDGASLEFNFNDLVRGKSQKSMASFKAEVVNESGELATLEDSNVEVKLQKVEIGTSGNSTITDKGNVITGIEIKNANSEKLGTLAYEITSNRINNSGKTLEVEVVSTVDIDDAEYTGNFMDESMRISIAVKNLNSPTWN